MNAKEVFHTIKNTPRLQSPVSVGLGVFFGLGCAVFLPFAIVWAAACYLIFKFGKDEVLNEPVE